jgi:hypothetical protein
MRTSDTMNNRRIECFFLQEFSRCKIDVEEESNLNDRNQ